MASSSMNGHVQFYDRSWILWYIQFKSLFIKNLILMRRQWGSTICLFLVPILTFCLAATMQLITNQSTHHSDKNNNHIERPFPMKLYTHNFHNESFSGFPYYLFSYPNDNLKNVLGTAPPMGRGGKGFLGKRFYEEMKIENLKVNIPFLIDTGTHQNLDDTLKKFTTHWHEKIGNIRNFNRSKIGEIREEMKDLIKEGKSDLAFSYGSLKFHSLATTTPFNHCDVTLVVPNLYGGWNAFDDERNSSYFSLYQKTFPQGDRYGQLLQFIDNTIANNIFGPRASADGPRIKTTYQGFPESIHDTFELYLMQSVFLFGFTATFVLPLFVSQFVLDKQERVLIMMRINGLNMLVYWITNYVFFYFQYLIALAAVFIASIILQAHFIVDTNALILFIFYFLWGWVIISLSSLLSIIFTKVKTSIIISYLFVCISILSSNLLNFTVFTEKSPSLIYFLFPPFVFYRAIFVLSQACIPFTCYTWDRFIHNSELLKAMMAMILSSIILSVIAWYLNEVLPQEYGTRKSIFFFLHCKKNRSYKNLSSNDKKKKSTNEVTDLESQNQLGVSSDHGDKCMVDQNHPLVIKHLSKMYNKPRKLALKDFSLELRKGELFGLLGANGAGKTTLLNILSGQTEATKGSFFIFGEKCDSHRLHREALGICPQFDIFYPDLTILEHLYFYGRIRGIDEMDIEQHIIEILNETSLYPSRHNLAKNLSGGMRRRLSLAISILSNPNIVILDEPTTGLDPCTKRELWNIFLQVKVNRTLLMTTHSMDEADILCDRIGIMVKGTLKAVDAPKELKLNYGSGYTLSLLVPKTNHHLISSKLISSLDLDFTEKLSLNDRLILNVCIAKKSSTSSLKSTQPPSTTSLTSLPSRQNHYISKLIIFLEHLKKEGEIFDWGINAPSLEDVFLFFAMSEDSPNNETEQDLPDTSSNRNDTV